MGAGLGVPPQAMTAQDRGNRQSGDANYLLFPFIGKGKPA